MTASSLFGPLSRAASGSAAVIPGLALACGVAAVAALGSPSIAKLVPVPPVVSALLLGMAVSHWAGPVFQPGLTWSVGRLLRVAVALLGVRIAFGDIVTLGTHAVFLVGGGMAFTVALAVATARAFGLRGEYGLLAGVANAVCGASAALATAAVLPNYQNKTADVAFTVVAANAVSTCAMLLYPVVGTMLGLNAHETGILVGGSIQDMAQVVGAGYAVSVESGDTAVIVKLFRILLLVPIVLLIGRYFAQRAPVIGEKRAPPLPGFAVAFLLLAAINSFAAGSSFAGVSFETIKTALGEFVNVAMLVAIAALGIKTSVRDLLAIGLRRVAVFLLAGLFIAVFVGGMLILRWFAV